MKAHKGWNICKKPTIPWLIIVCFASDKTQYIYSWTKASSEESLISDTNMHDMVTAGFSEVQHKLIV